ncbi:MAG TPA: HemK/PrmC family methyltransferase [bacterium]|nr:peptide chain release factor N(5)-glutamine methyltransferase [Candidatus Magasanikbacteria bacterium]MCA9389422.1 peptide chain release factor N(5)-glutamine methyltransferase [Candidatus Magasanikbacteria bacterium]HPF95760.1 HemK/PrmC family methyltransferase [bacterium]
MTINTWLNKAQKALLKEAPDSESARQEARYILAHTLKKDLTWTATHETDSLGFFDLFKADLAVLARRRGKPLAYVLGSQPFYGRDFMVNKHTLIPRPETEDMVDTALTIIKNFKQPIVIDIGTGSGAIACTMALETTNAHVYATELSKRALMIAKKNASALQANVEFTHASLLPGDLRARLSSATGDAVLICANLPYLPMSDKRALDRSVTSYEPHGALFTQDEGMMLNKQLILQVAEWRTIEYRPITLLLELDPPQATLLREFAEKHLEDSKTTIVKDRCERERFLQVEI